MSFIPGEAGGRVVGLTSGTGSGIVSTSTFGGIVNLTSGLVAGTNVALTPTSAFGGKGLRIDATPGTAGVNSITAGTGIALTGTSIDPIVGNSGVISVTGGTGIALTGTAANPIVGNSGVLSVATTGSGSGITLSGTAQNPVFANAGVLGVNSQQGQVSLTSSGGSVTITNPAAGTINLEAPSAGGGTLTAITAGAGISVTPTNPAQPTVVNTGVISLTAGNNMLVSAPSGAVILAATVPIPMAFSISGGLNNFPIAINNFGNFSINTLTTLGDLLAGTGAFTGVNTGTVIMDFSSFSLAQTTGQPGTFQVYVNVTGAPGAGLLVNTYNPSNPVGSTATASFSLGLVSFSMVDFRTAFGTGPGNASIFVGILNNNPNTLFPGAGYGLNSLAWYWPGTTL